MVKTQKGFTLIELMIVIAIIGILAAVAVPQYGQYTKRAKFAEVVTATAAVKTAVSLCYQTSNAIGTCNTNVNGVPADITPADPTRTVSELTTAAGVITATGGDAVDGETYILSPVNAANNNPLVDGDSLAWSVTGSCIAANLCRD